jgi:hypothetical protein
MINAPVEIFPISAGELEPPGINVTVSVVIPFVTDMPPLNVSNPVQMFETVRSISSVVLVDVPPTAIVPLGLVIVSPPPPVPHPPATH